MTMGIERILFNNPFVKEEVEDGKLVFIFDKKKHTRVLLHNLIAMQDNDEPSLTDVIITSKDNKEFHFHAPILAALSKQLEKLLLEQGFGSAKSKYPKNVRIKVDFSSEAVQCLWDYAYTSSVLLTQSNINEVGELAEYCYLDKLKKECQVLKQKSFEQGGEKEHVEFKDLAENILDRLQDLRDQGKQCSKIFKYSDPMTKSSCHSAIIAAACSEILFEMAYGDGNKNLDVDNKTYQVMVLFLQYLYTAELSIDKETVMPLLEFSLDFNIPSVGHACCSWLKFTLTTEKALDVMLDIAQVWKVKVKETNSKHGVNMSNELEDLYQYARSFVLRNFLSVKETIEYLVISFEELIDLIVDDDLVVNSEEEVFYAVMKWVEFDPETRTKDLPNLLQTVRLEHLSVVLLETITLHEYIITNSPCLGLIDIAQDCVSIGRSRRARCTTGMTCKHD